MWGGRESNYLNLALSSGFISPPGRCGVETARIDRGIIDYPDNRGQECTIVNIASMKFPRGLVDFHGNLGHDKAISIAGPDHYRAQTQPHRGAYRAAPER